MPAMLLRPKRPKPPPVSVTTLTTREGRVDTALPSFDVAGSTPRGASGECVLGREDGPRTATDGEHGSALDPQLRGAGGH